LAPEPALLLLDEPLTGLDRELHDRLIVELHDVLRTTATTAVLVSHDADEAAALASRILYWSDLQPV
jgi:thiamine transport system ATP-binding protein